jgi:uncharacterized protein (TIGR02646 family)
MELAKRLGYFCSYCEMPKKEAIDVEHKAPKVHAPHLERNWHNFLLSCTACNTRKSDNPAPSTLNDYLWPDLDNTFAAIAWHGDLAAKVADRTDAAVSISAAKTISLMKLDLAKKLTSKLKDLRHHFRAQAHAKALVSKALLEAEDTVSLRKQIAFTATEAGYFSVWMNVFEDDADMRRRFIEAFPGTARDCFDASGNPVKRPGGRV